MGENGGRTCRLARHVITMRCVGLSNKLLQCSKGCYLPEAAKESPEIPGGEARRPVLTARLKGVVVALAYVLLDYRRPPLRERDIGLY